MGILSLLLWTPALGVLVLIFTPSQHKALIRGIANLFSTLAFLMSGWILHLYQQNTSDLQFNEYFPLNPNLGSAYALGIDGLSMPMLVLATLLTSIALIASYPLTENIKGYYLSVLLLEFGLLGVFLAQDWALFYIAWELTLIPLFFLIGRWGGKRRHTASLNFVLYTMAGSIFMLISLLAISQYDLQQAGSLMTSMHQAAKDMPRNEQILVLLGFLIGFGVKMPIFPLHGWLPLAHVEAPSPISILLSGVLLKMGAYGLIRAVNMLPEAALILQPLLISLALFGMIYGGLLAWRQTDLKAMIAYSSVSHMGIVLLGIASLNQVGLTGAILQMSSHGLVSAALFLLIGLLYERSHTRNIQDYSGLIHTMPKFSLLVAFALLSVMGLPGTFGFIAELHAFIGGFQQSGALMIGFSITILISAAYAMRTINLLLIGPVKSNNPKLVDLNRREQLAAGFLIISIIGLGIIPNPVIELSATTINDMINQISQRLS
ncbi:MAG: NADH-quinone oxidoreductase subunit M [Methylococcales bacterium]|nr:NADH-quinone oxidoreductase subunit M [Methylococcales bacterium]